MINMAWRGEHNTAACHYIISINNDSGGGDPWVYVPRKCMPLYRCIFPARFARVVFFSFSFLLVSLHLSCNSSDSTQIPCWFFSNIQTTTSSRPSTASGHRVSKTVAGCPRDVYNNFFFSFTHRAAPAFDVNKNKP